MLDSKRKRLQATGWKVGTAKQFLQLSHKESARIERRLKFAERLKALRFRRAPTLGSS